MIVWNSVEVTGDCDDASRVIPARFLFALFGRNCRNLLQLTSDLAGNCRICGNSLQRRVMSRHNSGGDFGREVFDGTVCRAAEAVCSVASLVDRGGCVFVFHLVF
ncbi:MAG TPA: hypothetical protein DC058_06250 [Planctomycetaceae bacterium]|nr:hypothetical protein [Planctomycetaceae bacterium]HBC60803.1 hypothetical protein [Planctomycetaceae bacterium]